MTREKKFAILKYTLLGVVLAALLTVLLIFRNPIIETIRRILVGREDSESMRSYMKGLGFGGVSILFVLQFFQVLFPFFPSEPIQMASGITYGPFFGILLCLAGVVVANQVIWLMFYVFKRRTKSEKKRRQEAELIEQIKNSRRNIYFLIFLLYALPAVPIGLIAIVAIQSKRKYWQYTLLTILGPAMDVTFTVLTGSAIVSLSPVLSVIFLVLIVVVVVISIFNKRRIVKFIFRPKKTTEEKISSKVRKPNRLLYAFVKPVIKSRFVKKRNVHIRYDGVDMKNFPAPFVMLCNHPSVSDFGYVCPAMLPHKMAIMVNRYFFHGRLLGRLMRGFGLIPKKLYQPDVWAVKQTLRLAKSGVPVGIFPEGINSIHGAFMGVSPATAKLVKLLKLPVISVKIEGAYLTTAKWRIHEKPRVGRIDVTVKQFMTAEESKEIAVDDLHGRIAAELDYDDFKWASENKVEYATGNLADGIERILYRCPKCGSEFELKAEGDAIECLACGNGVAINRHYEIAPLKSGDTAPASISAWYDGQRADMFAKVQADDFSMSADVALKMFDEYGHREAVAGHGRLELTHAGLKYRWAKGKEIDLDIPWISLPGITLDTVTQNIELYYMDVFYGFKLGIEAVKWTIAVEQNHKYMSEADK